MISSPLLTMNEDNGNKMNKMWNSKYEHFQSMKANETASKTKNHTMKLCELLNYFSSFKQGDLSPPLQVWWTQ